MKKRERMIRLAFDDIWDITFKKHYIIVSKRPYLETVRTIIYVPKDDSISKIKIL